MQISAFALHKKKCFTNRENKGRPLSVLADQFTPKHGNKEKIIFYGRLTRECASQIFYRYS